MTALSALITRARIPLRDSAGVFVTDPDLIAIFNEAQNDLANRLQITKTSATGTTSGNTIALPADLVEPTSLLLGTEDEVLWVDDDTYDAWVESANNPGYFLARVFGSNVEIYPTPDTGTAYALRYVSSPTDFTATTDTVTLPEELQTKMVQYAQSEALFKEGELQKADRKKAEYENGLPENPLGRKRIMPGNLVIGFAFNDFDTDPGSMHL